MPKWTKGFRPGRTYIDVYKLFSKEELSDISTEELKRRTDEALLFDAYEDQDANPQKYKNCDNIEGLENVLYKCPNCTEEFKIRVKDRSVIYCEACGFEEKADEYGFLHKTSEVGEEIRYVSHWSKWIYEELMSEISKQDELLIRFRADISTIDERKHKFINSGDGEITVTKQHVTLSGVVKGEKINVCVPTCAFPSLPFKPGKYLELQHESDIFRLYPEDGRQVMKYINTVKAVHQLHDGECQRCAECETAHTV
jgi:predicted RNA-binding Zn-ribbon protein involved in translation (DUF1610 family)